MSHRGQRDSISTGVLILIGANVLFFLATTIHPDPTFSLGLKPASVSERPWTAVTSLFIHDGIWHILTNMLTLYFFGGYLSSLIGEVSLFIIYFGGGIAGSLLFILLAPSSSIGIGASGAVFALGGALTVMRPQLRVIAFPIPVPLPLWVAVIGGFVIMSLLPNIAWQAHLGGLAFGLVAGYVLSQRRRRSS